MNDKHLESLCKMQNTLDSLSDIEFFNELEGKYKEGYTIADYMEAIQDKAYSLGVHAGWSANANNEVSVLDSAESMRKEANEVLDRTKKE